MIYLDYNATTPLAPTVVKEITKTLQTAWGNPSSNHSAGVQAKKLIATARNHIKRMLNASHANEVVFTSGGTEANNHVIFNGMEYFKEQRTAYAKAHVISSTIEHDSISKPLERLEREGMLEVTLIGVDVYLGRVNVRSIMQNVRENTVLVTIMLANNETGAIQPIADLAAALQKLNGERVKKNLPRILLHTDAAQAIGKIYVDVNELGVDYLTVVGHKFYGPRIGALWVKSCAPLHPMMIGGGQEMDRRSGTENTCMIVGLGEACRLVCENINHYKAHFQQTRDYLKDRLKTVFAPGTVAFNELSCGTLPNTLSVYFPRADVTGREILNCCQLLQASVGAACHSNQQDCGSAVLLAHGVAMGAARTSIRLSVGRETSKSEIDFIVEDLYKAVSSR